MSKISGLKGNKIFFTGIGGSSMSGLALLLKKEGYEVSGSDMQDSVKLQHLKDAGIPVAIGHSAENVRGFDALVYTAAVRGDNPELAYARQNGLQLIKRSQLVGMIMKMYRQAVAISGTKGKTTTTALVTTILLECGLEPSALIGGTAKNIGSNVRVGESRVIVAEACEYEDSFLDFCPTVGVILNVEMEHTDYFKSMEQLKGSFRGFAARLPEDGVLIGCGDCPVTREIIRGDSHPHLLFGIDTPSDLMAENIVQTADGFLCFDLILRGEKAIQLKTPIIGRHNAYNVLAAVAAALQFDLSLEEIARALLCYKGAGRRFDYYGSINGAAVYDDYAHTPDEYRAVIESADYLPHGRLICIFQPHTYSRSIDFFEETVAAFARCDEVIMIDIYAAREKDEGKIHSRDFARAMQEKGIAACYMESFDRVCDYVEQTAKEGDIVLVIGAGTSNKLCEMIAARGVPTQQMHGD